jgi:DNA-directed RNA polymerase specialized sigma24 family protein
MSEVEEKQLDSWMADLSRGDRSVFDRLFRELYPRAFYAARRQLREAEAHDAAQTALMKIFARAERFEAGLPALPWFYATLANELRTAVRRDRREAGRFTPYDPIACPARGTSVDPEALLVDKELAFALEDAIARLDGKSAEAIAALLGRTAPPAISDAALRKRISRGYLRLRELLGGGT